MKATRYSCRLRQAKFFRTIKVCLAVLLSHGCASPEAPYFEVTGIEQGKKTKKDGVWSVYETGNKLVYTENGYCTADRRIHRCMQYGGIIHYKTNMPKVVLNCHYSSVDEISIAYPEEVSSDPVTQGEFQLTLDGGDSKYHKNSYLIAGEEDPAETHNSTTICYFDGREVIRFHWEILMPVPENPETG